MPVRQEIAYLRSSAQRLREIARFDTPISPQLIKMADDLEARADELEKAGQKAMRARSEWRPPAFIHSPNFT